MLNQLYIVTLYLVRCYLTSVVLTTGGTLWNLVMSSQLMVVQSSDFLPLFTPRFADPYFESSKNMASSHLDGKFHQFHHQKLSSRSLVYHGKKYGESCHFMAEQFRIILIYPGDCGMMEYGLVLFDQKRGENSVFCELEMFLFCLEY